MTHAIPTIAALTAILALTACTQPTPSASANANTPGWTGTTVVPGSTSSIADNAQATYLQQKWGSPVRR